MEEIYTINISHCFVQNSTTNAVSVLAPNLSIHVSYSTFYYCTSSSAGAAIYFRSESSNIEYVCGSYCSGETIDDNTGSFISINLDMYQNKVNIVNMVSASYSPNNENIFGSITLTNGEINCKNVNASKNYGYYNPSIYILPYYSMGDYLATTMYVNINNCTSKNAIFQFSFSTQEFSFGNIINNIGYNELDCICRVYEMNATFTSISFLGNVGKLIYMKNSELVLISCNCDVDNYGMITSGSASVTNQFEINTFTQMNEKGTRCVYKVKLTVMKNNKSFKLRPYTMLFLINHSS